MLTALYANMGGDPYAGMTTGRQSISLMTGLSSDELDLFSELTDQTYQTFYQNRLEMLNASSSNGISYWSELYNKIFICNSAIEGLMQSEKLTPSVKNQLLGEAKFTRAFFYFHLINLFGDVPLVTTTDYKVNSNLERSSISSVYQQMITDLKEAKDLLRIVFFGWCFAAEYAGVQERVRPTTWAASALLARVYL